jgi:hypothetical protein
MDPEDLNAGLAESGPAFDTDGENGRRQKPAAASHAGELARELQLVQENARRVFVRCVALVVLRGLKRAPRDGPQEELR